MKKEQFKTVTIDEYFKLIEKKDFYPKRYRVNSFSKLLYLYKNSFINMKQYNSAYNRLMKQNLNK